MKNYWIIIINHHFVLNSKTRMYIFRLRCEFWRRNVWQSLTFIVTGTQNRSTHTHTHIPYMVCMYLCIDKHMENLLESYMYIVQYVLHILKSQLSAFDPVFVAIVDYIILTRVVLSLAIHLHIYHITCVCTSMTFWFIFFKHALEKQSHTSSNNIYSVISHSNYVHIFQN